MSELEQIVGPGAILGEGPVWDQRESVLWWLDIPGQQLHRFDPATGDDTAVEMGMQVGSLAPRASGGLVLATPRGVEAYDPKTEERSVLVAIEGDDPTTRMNDGKCDRSGRFFAGTMAYDLSAGAARFYRVDPDLHVTTILEGVTISNGLAWSRDDSRMYYIDTMTYGIDVFDYDPDTGAVTGRRQLAATPEGQGAPDGMCIDADDHLWVASFGGGVVWRFRPDGTLDGVIEVPADQVTCCAFGGPELDVLYITTAAQDLSDDDRRRQPDAGSVYAIRPGVKGTPVNAFAG